MTDDRDLFQDAEDLFVARTTTARPASPDALLMHDLVRFVRDPEFQLTPGQQRRLFTTSKLRHSLQRLKRELAQSAVPMAFERAAAASDRELTERRFPGGTIRMGRSEVNQQQMIVVIEHEKPGASARFILLEGAEGGFAKLKLEPADDEGVIQLLLDLTVPANAEAIRLLGDPNTSGTFL